MHVIGIEMSQQNPLLYNFYVLLKRTGQGMVTHVSNTNNRHRGKRIMSLSLSLATEFEGSLSYKGPYLTQIKNPNYTKP